MERESHESLEPHEMAQKLREAAEPPSGEEMSLAEALAMLDVLNRKYQLPPDHAVSEAADEFKKKAKGLLND